MPEIGREDIRERLIRSNLLAPIATLIGGKSVAFSDSVLHIRDLVRPVLSIMYRIAKTHAATDVKLRTTIAPAIDFYAKAAQKSAATRKANAELKAQAQTAAQALAQPTAPGTKAKS